MKRKKCTFKEESFKIVSGVPIPKAKVRSRFEGTLKKMKVGDSIGNIESVSGIFRCAKKMGIKLTSRKVSDFPKAFRIWRIK